MINTPGGSYLPTNRSKAKEQPKAESETEPEEKKRAPTPKYNRSPAKKNKEEEESSSDSEEELHHKESPVKSVRLEASAKKVKNLRNKRYRTSSCHLSAWVKRNRSKLLQIE